MYRRTDLISVSTGKAVGVTVTQHIPTSRVDMKLKYKITELEHFYGSEMHKVNTLHRLVEQMLNQKGGRTSLKLFLIMSLRHNGNPGLCKKQEEIPHVPMSDSLYFDIPAFLYQEYRDTSKQQEIEQRRQRDSLSPGVMAGTVVAEAPPALQLQLRNSARSLSLWQNLEAVQASGLLTQLPQKEIIIQEVSYRILHSRGKQD